MEFRKFLTYRATIVSIGIPLVAISMSAMLNTTDMDGTLLIIIFAIVYMIHLVCDKFWSWLMLLPFFVAYIILLWINFFRDYHLLGSKYLVDEYIYNGGLFIGISIILFIMYYLLKPPHKVS